MKSSPICNSIRYCSPVDPMVPKLSDLSTNVKDRSPDEPIARGASESSCFQDYPALLSGPQCNIQRCECRDRSECRGAIGFLGRRELMGALCTWGARATARRWTFRSTRARSVGIASTGKRIESRAEGPLMDQRAHDGWRKMIEGISLQELHCVIAHQHASRFAQ